MAYNAQDFTGLLGLEGFSDELLNNHFKLYEGYVKNTNKAAELLEKTDPSSYEFGEINRRFGWEFDGMRLHELYFGNLMKGSKGFRPEFAVGKKIEEAFGSYDAWKADFLATAGMRGIGWAVLYYDVSGGRLFNVWVNEHDTGHLAGGVPLLVCDAFEHAFMVDYGLKKADYLDSFMNAVCWHEVNTRFEAAA